MYTETVKRIKEGLKKSKDGQLRWLQGELAPLDLIILDDMDNQNKKLISSSSSGKEEIASTIFSTPTRANKKNEEKKVWKDRIQQYFLNYDNKTLEFLANGFEELLKCRSVSNYKLSSWK